MINAKWEVLIHKRRSQEPEAGMEEDFSVSGQRYETLFVICYTLHVKDHPKSTKPFKSLIGQFVN